MADQAASVSTWLKFFKDAGIPTGLGANYAVIFCDHRIHKEVLGELNREILTDMGIKAMGDIIAILKHARTVAEQVSRENFSRLMSEESVGVDKVKQTPSSPKKDKVQSSNGKTDESTSVFSRLGQNVDDSKGSGVFKRLGEPIVTTTTIDPKEQPKTFKTKLVTTEVSSSSEEQSPKKVAIKRKHVFDRLGPEAADQSSSLRSSKVENTKRSSVLTRLGRTPEPDSKSSDGEYSSSDDEVRPKVIRLNEAKAKVHVSASKNLVIMKMVNPIMERKSKNVLQRLGDKVSSSTSSPGGKPVSKRVFTDAAKAPVPSQKLWAVGKPLAMDSEPRLSAKVQRTIKTAGNSSAERRASSKKVLAMDSVPASSNIPMRRRLAMNSDTKSSNLALRKSVKAITKSNERSTRRLSPKPAVQRLGLRVKAKSDRGLVDKGTSAGMLKSARSSASVFDRLGGK